MTKDLEIGLYKEKEHSAIGKFPIYLVREFVPVTFERFGFQTTIADLKDLWKFADSQQEFRYEENINLLGGGLTSEEFRLLNDVTSKVIKYTTEMQHPIVGRNALTRSFLPLRGIESIANSRNLSLRDLRVLEIGPGSGYLGLLCRLKGIKYYAVEITQSFYFHQHYFWKSCLDEADLYECLDDEIPDKDFVHIPWWTWANINIQLPNFDVIIINHAVNEISSKGFRFLMRRLSDSFKGGYLLVESWGGGDYRENYKTLLASGVNLLHQTTDSNDGYTPVSVMNFMPISKRVTSRSIESRSLAYKVFKTMLPRYFKKKILFLLNSFCEFENMRSINNFYTSKVVTHFSAALVLPRVEIRKAELDTFYEILSSQSDLYTEDEKFGHYINSTWHASPKM